MALDVLLDGSKRVVVEHTATFEFRKAARDSLGVLSGCPLFGDILEPLDDDLRRALTKNHVSFGLMRRRIIEELAPLRRQLFCHRSKKLIEVVLGDVVVCGIPCVDYSSMGQRQGLSGPTAIIILMWIRLMQVHQPAFIVIEEVVPFRTRGLPLIEEPDMLGLLYAFQTIELGPRNFGLPVNRPRMYCIGVHRQRGVLSRPLLELLEGIPLHTAPWTGRDFSS